MAQEILVSINVNSGQAEARLKGVKKATDETKISTALYEKSINDLTEAELRQIIAEQKVVVQRKITTKSVQQLAAAELSAAEAAKGNRAQSGLSNAILLETGRLASDASFGFTAIANNLSQLITLFQSFARTSGGFTNSLKRLGQSLMGSGGILILVQLLISFAPKIVAFFTDGSEGAKKFREELEKLTSELNAQRIELLGYIDVLRSQTASEKVRLNALKELETVVPGLTKNNKDQKLSLEELTVAVDEYIKQQQLRAELDALISNNAELFDEREKVRVVQRKLEAAETQKEREKILLKNQSLLERLGTFGSQIGNIFSTALSADGYKEIDLVELFKEQNAGLLEEYNLVINRIAEIQRRLTADPETDNGGGSKARQRRLKAFIAGQKDYEKETEKSQKRLLDMFFKDEKARVINANQTRIQLLRITQEQFKEREKARLAAYIKERDDDIKAEEAKKKVDQKRIDELNAAKVQAIKDSNAEIEKSEKSLSTAIVAINNETAAKLNNIDLERARNIEILNDKRLLEEARYQDEVENLPKIFREREKEEKIKQLKEDVKLQEALLLTFVGTEEEKEKAMLRLAALRRKLNKEELSLERQKFEQTKYIFDQGLGTLEKSTKAFSNVQINNLEDVYDKRIRAAKGNADLEARLEEELLEKKDRIQRKQFRIDQIARISRALMNTYETGFLAFGSQLTPGNPFSFAQAPLAQKATILNGLAQVALIASQKYDSPNRKAVSGRGAAGGGVEVEAPDFNVVGASPIGQLVGGVGAAIGGKPIKAYVSGKDILDSMQEYERNINNSST
jgi:hypothetical protein